MVLGARSGNIHVHYMELRGTFIYPSMLSVSVHSAYPRPIRARSASYALYSHIHWLYQCQLFRYKLHQFIPPYPLSNIYIYIYIYELRRAESRADVAWISTLFAWISVRCDFNPNCFAIVTFSILFAWILNLFAWIRHFSLEFRLFSLEFRPFSLEFQTFSFVV